MSCEAGAVSSWRDALRRFVEWGNKLDAPHPLDLTKPVPSELRGLLDQRVEARVTWQGLSDQQRAGLAAFVASGLVARTRRRYARVVTEKCAEGPDALHQWVARNRSIPGEGLSMPGWTFGP
jgi:hypothetical protein